MASRPKRAGTRRYVLTHPSVERSYPVLSRPFLTLALAMFTAMMGISMVTPILPVYAKAQGASGPEIGRAFSSFAIVQLFISPSSGRLRTAMGGSSSSLRGSPRTW